MPRLKIVNRYLEFSAGAILFITLIAKFLALWRSTRLTMRPDPVLPFLSSDLTIGIAVAIEAVVFAFLVFGSDPKTKGVLLLWMAGVFATYRILWRIAVDSNDPCPCLGFIAQLVGLSATTGNMISVVILLWLAGVGIVLIRGACAAALSESSVAAIRTPLNMFLFLPVATAGIAVIAGGASAHADDLSVTGRAEVIYEGSPQHEEIAFQFQSGGGRFLVHETGFSDTNIVAKEFYYEGKMGHSILRFSPDRLAPALVVDATTGEPGFSTNVLKKPENDGTLRLRYDPVPEAATTVPLWLAFDSADYFKAAAAAGGKIQKLFDVERARRKESKPAEYTVEWDETAKSAPRRLLTICRSSGIIITNEAFLVNSWTNVGSLKLPREFSFQIFTSIVPPFGNLLTTINYTVDSVTTNSAPWDVKPDLAGSINVLDERFAPKDPSVALVHYYITNGVIPAESVIKATSMYAAAYRSEYGATPLRLRMLWYALLAAAFFFPIGWMALRRNAVNKQTHENIN